MLHSFYARKCFLYWNFLCKWHRNHIITAMDSIDFIGWKDYFCRQVVLVQSTFGQLYAFRLVSTLMRRMTTEWLSTTWYELIVAILLSSPKGVWIQVFLKGFLPNSIAMYPPPHIALAHLADWYLHSSIKLYEVRGLSIPIDGLYWYAHYRVSTWKRAL